MPADAPRKRKFSLIRPAEIRLGEIEVGVDKRGKPYWKAPRSTVTFQGKEPLERTVMAFPHALNAVGDQLISGAVVNLAARWDNSSVVIIGEVLDKAA